ncbi:hypothetical protein PFDG_05328 [Plasmodium falciparum Dd2]|uniref:Uncharacterized protein n=1 Tax=Plasmodium falciparum (isolate Dd2) TaxID=57267 RepID=A0A0L7MB08_PLAF4|nr:hypothetical protein PFDG_05328 [Plasmodium falciparum Dd2]
MSNKQTCNNLNEQNKSQFFFDDLQKVRQVNKCDNKLYKMNFKTEILSDDYIILKKNKSNKMDYYIYNNVINHRHLSADMYLNHSKSKANNSNLVNSVAMTLSYMEDRAFMHDYE